MMTEFSQFTPYIRIYSGKKYIEVDISSIIYCEAHTTYTKIYRKDSEVIIGSGCLKKYEAKLGNYGFIRTNDGYLVNVRYIQRFPYRSLNTLILLSNGVMLEVSRRKKKEAYQKWRQYLEGGW